MIIPSFPTVSALTTHRNFQRDTHFGTHTNFRSHAGTGTILGSLHNVTFLSTLRYKRFRFYVTIYIAHLFHSEVGRELSDDIVSPSFLTQAGNNVISKHLPSWKRLPQLHRKYNTTFAVPRCEWSVHFAITVPWVRRFCSKLIVELVRP